MQNELSLMQPMSWWPQTLRWPTGCAAKVTRCTCFLSVCDYVLFSGAESVSPSLEITLPAPVALLMGTVNERIDVDLLEAVADAGCW